MPLACVDCPKLFQEKQGFDSLQLIMSTKRRSANGGREKASKALKVKEELPDKEVEGHHVAKIFDALLFLGYMVHWTCQEWLRLTASVLWIWNHVQPLRETVLAGHGSVEEYLNKKLCDQDRLRVKMWWLVVFQWVLC